MISTGKCLLYSSVTRQLIIVMENSEYSVPPLVVLALSFFSFLLLTIFFCHQTHLTKSRLFFLLWPTSCLLKEHAWFWPVRPVSLQKGAAMLKSWKQVESCLTHDYSSILLLGLTAGVCFYLPRTWHMTTNAAYGDAWFAVEKFVFCGFLSVLSGRRVLAHRALFMCRHRK